MELRHLRYFEALAENLNFTRAAERLHVTQSTLSHQIRQLEDELGVSLFDRSAKRVRITEAGELLRSHLTPAMESIDRGVQALRGEEQPLSARITIGSTPSFNARLIPRCVALFMSRYPNAQVEVEEMSAAMIARRIQTGRQDLAVSYRPEKADALWFQPLYTEEMKLVISGSHPLAKRRRVRLIELHGLRMVLLPPVFETRALLEACFEAAGARPVVTAHFNSIAPTLELIAQTDLAGIVAHSAVPADSSLRVIALGDPTPVRTPGLLWKKGATRSPMIKHFAELVRAAVQAERLQL